MRNAVTSVIWFFLAGTTLAQNPQIPSSPAPVQLTVQAVADPAQGGSNISDVEKASRAFASFIDDLSHRLSHFLGAWADRELFLQITIGKVVLALISALITLLLLQIARYFFANRRFAVQAPTSERFWIGGLVSAFWRGLKGFFYVTAILLFVSPLLPYIVIATNSQAAFKIVSRLAEIGYFAALLTACYSVVRLVNVWLRARAEREPRKWFYPAFPLAGQLLYYNFLLTSLHYAIDLLHLPGAGQAIAYRIVSIVGVLVNTIMLIQMVRALEDIAVVRSELHGYDSYKFRSLQTRLRVLRQLVVFVLVLVGVAGILMNIDAVRQIGTGLLASAGVAGVIVGLAAQKSLGTIIAGMQIALTNPMKIGDVVVVEGENGTIEEITLTYVVVKAWDQRRLILPITYFLEKTFQNWTYTSSELLGTVFLYVDYMIPVDDIRSEAQRLVSESKLWDKRAFGVQVTDWNQNTIEVRILVSAETAGNLFNLRCEIREKILRYLQEREPIVFPQVRYLTDGAYARSETKSETRNISVKPTLPND